MRPFGHGGMWGRGSGRRQGGDGAEGPGRLRLSRDTFASVRRLFGYLRPHWLMVAILVLLTVANVGLGLVGPWLTKQLIDRAILPRNIAALKPIVLALFAASSMGMLVGYASGYLSQMVGHRIIRRMRNELFEHLQTLSLRFFERHETGSIMSRVTNDTEAVQGALVNSVQTVVRSVLTLAGAVTMMFVLNARLALVAFLPVPVFIASIVFYATQLKARYRVFREKIAELNAFLQQRIVGVRVVKSFAREPEEQAAMEEKTTGYYRAFMRAALVQSSIFPWMSYLGAICALSITLVGGMMVIREVTSLGTVLAFLALLQYFLRPIGQMGGLIGHTIPAGLAAAERVFEFLDEQDRLPVRPHAIRPDHLRGEVEMRDVTFAYNGENVLESINLHIRPAETVALVGPSGVGKTTLADLVLRFYDVEHGRVLIDGRDIKDYDPRALRRHMGVVLQEPFLFNVSVRENIAYGNPDATDDAIRAAAARAEADEFIRELPEDYDTVVGERGVKLSVGQKQRISIARALVKDPAILILDEATSAVDTMTEKAIQRALEAASRDRTTLLIAHRLSTTFIADRIVVLQHGRIVEEGTAEELLRVNGLFAKLYHMQMLDAMPGG